MQEPTGDVESCHHNHYSAPFSQRELHSVHLEWAMAPSGTEEKHILDEAGMTVEELGEHFEIDRSGIVDAG